jgi:hypothetical protein
MDNGLSQCNYHHGRHHGGAFRIRKLGNNEVIFETPDGREIERVKLQRVDPETGGPTHLQQLARNAGIEIEPETPRAASGGGCCDLGYAVEVLAAATHHPRAGP